jgi:PhzF family phenazine biosynthesis protein
VVKLGKGKIMKIPLYQIDAFTDQVFGGNPAAVCPLKEWIGEDLPQKIAAENNLSETAFFVKVGDEYELRWFTPTLEVDLCGHATLATAYVIFFYINEELKQVTFHSQSGILKVKKENELLVLDFPSRKPQPFGCPPDLERGIGVIPIEVLKDRDFYAVLKNQREVEAIIPDFQYLEKLDSLGVCVTAEGESVDFVSRFFAPRAGVNEDPVTGSAHSSLIPYWADKLNKRKLNAIQLSKRKGHLFCENLEDRVLIGGKAVTYAIGAINI